MIGSLISNSNHVTVSGGVSSAPYISPGAAGAGMMRWNPNMQCVEVNNGNTWLPFNESQVCIDLGPDEQRVLEWAARKMQEEENLEAMMEKYPALRKAKENFDLVLNLTKDDYKANK